MLFVQNFGAKNLQSLNISREKLHKDFSSKKARVKHWWNWHLAELNQKIVEKLPVKIFAHLIENEPVPDSAVRDETFDQIQILTSLEIPEMKF